ncbi:MAG: RnfABCDGE type electron transport complex subunit G [Candidatus Theseobacter exili]|nr:RnfABCDGE type electron transport complex subunit G [Candidatus Theseobacter exili]
MREFVKLSLSLSIACLIAAIVLAIVHAITAGPIDEQNKRAELEAVTRTLPNYDNDPVADKKILTIRDEQKTFYIGKKDGKVVGVAFETFGEGYSGKIFVMVGITPEGVVSGIQIRSQQETPGLGARITEPSFYNQYKDVSLSMKKGLVNGKLAVDKDGGNVDSITGATISSRGVTQAVNIALEIFKKYKKDII